jgi:signal peptidase I
MLDPGGTGVAVDLAVRTLRRRGRLALRVTGASMLPSVLPGEVVFVRQGGIAGARRGELVLFRRDGRLFVHRVVARGDGGALVTRGDANPASDGTVRPAEFLGRVVRQLRRGRAFTPHREPPAAVRAAAALFRRSTLAVRCFLRVHAMLAARA